MDRPINGTFGARIQNEAPRRRISSSRSATGGRSASASRNSDRSVLMLTQLDTAERTCADVETAVELTPLAFDATCPPDICPPRGAVGACTCGLPLRTPRAFAPLCNGAPRPTVGTPKPSTGALG